MTKTEEPEDKEGKVISLVLWSDKPLAEVIQKIEAIGYIRDIASKPEGYQP